MKESKVTYFLRKNIFNTIILAITRLIRHGDEKDNAKAIMLGGVALVFLGVSSTFAIKDFFAGKTGDAVGAAFGAVASLIFIILSILSLNFISIDINEETALEERVKAEKRARETNDPIDFLNLDVRKLNEYYSINQKQLRYSFILAALAMVVGLTVFTWGIVDTIKGSEISKELPKVLSGSVLEIVSGLFFTFYFKNQARSKFYFEHLLQIQRVMLAFNLLQKETNKKIATNLKIVIAENLLKVDVRSLFENRK